MTATNSVGLGSPYLFITYLRTKLGKIKHTKDISKLSFLNKIVIKNLCTTAPEAYAGTKTWIENRPIAKLIFFFRLIDKNLTSRKKTLIGNSYFETNLTCKLLYNVFDEWKTAGMI